MKKIVIFLALGALITSCGEKKEEKKDGFEVSRTKTEDTKAETKESVPVDLDNKGVGPITNVEFPEEINDEMVARGKAKFDAICVACHMIDKRMIGPALKGVYDRRSPEWVMNMILNAHFPSSIEIHRQRVLLAIVPLIRNAYPDFLIQYHH